jgi:hypothetical protein
MVGAIEKEKKRWAETPTEVATCRHLDFDAEKKSTHLQPGMVHYSEIYKRQITLCYKKY